MELDGPQLDSVVPIVLISGYKVPAEVIGSGVVVRLFGLLYLLSAAHVLDNLQDRNLFVPGRETFVPVTGRTFCSISPPSGRKYDMLDVGFVRFEEANKMKFDPRVRSLRRSEFREDWMSTRRLNVYTFVGYPTTKSRARGIYVITKPQRFTGLALSPKDLKRCGIDPEVNIAINFHRRKSLRGNSQRLTAPMPVGLSGGGIFAWPKVRKGDPIPKKISFGGYRTHLPRSGIPACRNKNRIGLACYPNSPRLSFRHSSIKTKDGYWHPVIDRASNPLDDLLD